MAKHMVNSRSRGTSVGIFASEFIGSLFYLYLVYLMAADKMVSSIVFTGAGAFWLPLFVGVSIVAAIALFFTSFTYLSEPKLIAGEHTKNLGLKLAAVTGVTFFALTIGTGYFVIALAGFILTVIGGMAGYRL